MSDNLKVDVELCGGPFDGEEQEVRLLAPGMNVYLFRREEPGGGFGVWAYKWADRTTAGGRRWVLDFMFKAARQGGVAS